MLVCLAARHWHQKRQGELFVCFRVWTIVAIVTTCISLYCQGRNCLLYTNLARVLGCVWLVPILKTVDLANSEFEFDWLTNSENGRFGRFGRPAEPSAPKAEGLADFAEILIFSCETLKTRQTRLFTLCFALCCQGPDSSSWFSTGNLVLIWNLLVWRIFCLIGKCVSVSAKSIVFRIW